MRMAMMARAILQLKICRNMLPNYGFSYRDAIEPYFWKNISFDLNHPKVSVVILNWNGKNYLQQFLPSLQKTTYPNMEIIIADNGSTDGSLEFLEASYPSLRLIRFTQNYGFAKGYNEALKQIDSPYYVLLNSDVEVPAGWLEPMVQLLEENDRIAALQPKPFGD